MISRGVLKTSFAIIRIHMSCSAASDVYEVWMWAFAQFQLQNTPTTSNILLYKSNFAGMHTGIVSKEWQQFQHQMSVVKGHSLISFPMFTVNGRYIRGGHSCCGMKKSTKRNTLVRARGMGL